MSAKVKYREENTIFIREKQRIVTSSQAIHRGKIKIT